MTPLPLPLLTWLSPVFPTGGFAYSGGLETAVAEGRVRNAEELGTRLDALLRHGSVRNDAIFIALGARDDADHGRLCATACAFAGSAERLRETLDQGSAFRAAARHWVPTLDELPAETPLPIALGFAASRLNLPAHQTLSLWLHAFVSAQCQAAIRLSITGQDGAARVMQELEAAIEEVADQTFTATEDDLGTACFAAEIDALRHETLSGRLFLS